MARTVRFRAHFFDPRRTVMARFLRVTVTNPLPGKCMFPPPFCQHIIQNMITRQKEKECNEQPHNCIQSATPGDTGVIILRRAEHAEYLLSLLNGRGGSPLPPARNGPFERAAGDCCPCHMKEVNPKTGPPLSGSGSCEARGEAEMRRISFAPEGWSRSDGEADRKGPRAAFCCVSEFVPCASAAHRVCFPRRFGRFSPPKSPLFWLPKHPTLMRFEVHRG